MEGGYLEVVSKEMGVSIWILLIISVWTIIWKLMGMWKAAKKKSIPWFIVLALLNTVGILPILYIYVFSEMNFENKIKKIKKEKLNKKKKF